VDVAASETAVYTVQAMSEEETLQWLDAMKTTCLDGAALTIVEACIAELESRGLRGIFVS